MERELGGIGFEYWGIARVIMALLALQNFALKMHRSLIYKTCPYCNLDNPKKLPSVATVVKSTPQTIKNPQTGRSGKGPLGIFPQLPV